MGYYVVRLDQGDYLQLRGGHDWGRSGKGYATWFTREDAERWARNLSSFGAKAEEADDPETAA